MLNIISCQWLILVIHWMIFIVMQLGSSSLKTVCLECKSFPSAIVTDTRILVEFDSENISILKTTHCRPNLLLTVLLPAALECDLNRILILLAYLYCFDWAHIHPFIQTISLASPQVHYLSEALPKQHEYCAGISCQSTTGNCELRTCPRSLRGG